MAINRRQFLRNSAMVGAGTLMLRGTAWPFTQSQLGITKFAVTLPGLGPNGANSMGNYISVMSPNKTKIHGTDYYELVAKQFTQQVHPAIPPTTFYGYADAKTLDSRYLGGVIVATRHTPIMLKLSNHLPARHILPVDPTLVDPAMSAETGGRQDRIANHLHGGLVQWESDGGPFNWFSNADAKNGGFVHGSSFINDNHGTAGPGAAVYNYPNDQSARLLWYHDHAYGLTRTNAYAGIASAYIVTDSAEALLVASHLIPSLDGAFPVGIPLVIQDKTFWNGATGTDPDYSSVVPAGAVAGSLWYPHIYEENGASPTGRWDWGGIADPGGSYSQPPPVSSVPEFFSDVTLVNGAPYPKLPVDRRRYRFRLLNGSQGRFYNLQLYVADKTPDGITLKASGKDNNGNDLMIPVNPSGPRMLQIGNEAGFLEIPVVLNNPATPLGYKLTGAVGDPTVGSVNRYNLLLGSAERADIIIDFRDVAAGSQVILYNDAPAPFPGGDIRNDYYPGAPDNTSIGGAPTPTPGQGPDTRILMRFDVSSLTSTEISFNQTLLDLTLVLPVTFLTTQPALPSTKIRPIVKTLNEAFDPYGRLIQKLGTGIGGIDYLAMPADIAKNGETQVWQIYNLTADTHPMHFHLVNVRVVKRESWQFDAAGNPLNGILAPIANSDRGPDRNERGYKETVRVNPGEVVTVAMRFDLPKGLPLTPSPRLKASYGITGAEYVWHCHILEHEEHDMMHALVVTP